MEDYSGAAGSGDNTKFPTCLRGHWRPVEDEKLRQLVKQHGAQNWNSIAEKLQGRSGKSCRLRWFNQLDPRINRRPFTEEEEERLLAAHRLQGNKWALIARHFPGRTDNAVKNQWHVIVARKQREQFKSGGIWSFHDTYKDCSTTQFPSKYLHDHSNIESEPQEPLIESITGPDENNSKLLEFRRPLNIIKDRRFWEVSSAAASSSNLHSWNLPPTPTTSNNSTLVHLSKKEGKGSTRNASDRSFIHRYYSNFSNYNDLPGLNTFNYRRVVPSPFGYLSVDDFEGSEKNIGDFVSFKSNTSAFRNSRAPTEEEQGDGDESNEHKEVPFIDFLGVGISSS